MRPAHAADDWPRIWLALTQHPWTSLAVVPNEPGINVRGVCERLAATARLHGDKRVRLLDATGVQLSNVSDTVASITAAAGNEDFIIVPVDEVTANPAAAAVARATSAAILVVRLGSSHLTPARETLEAVGRSRFIGSIVVDDATAAT